MITRIQKHSCALREVALRRGVYAKRVRAGQMLQPEGEREIAVMQAIADDYAPDTPFDREGEAGK